jgi:hypothetical protein
MKWIGQHIWDFISRFRNDVYLENLSTTSEDEILVVDANGKISKKNESTLAIDVSDFMTNGADNYIVTATGADSLNAEANFTFDGTNLDLTSTSTTAAVFDIVANDLTTGSFAKFAHQDALTTASSNNGLFEISWTKTGITGDGLTRTVVGEKISLSDNAVNHANSVTEKTGLTIQTINTNAQGTTTNRGATIVTTGAATNIGLSIASSGEGLVITDVSDADDYCSIATTTHGATTFKTFDDSSHAADLTFDIDGLTHFTGDGVHIEPGASAGVSALEITDTDVDQHAVEIVSNNTAKDVLSIATATLTTGKPILVTQIDVGTTTLTTPGTFLYYAKAGVTASGQTKTATGFTSHVYDAATNHASSTNNLLAGKFKANFDNDQGTNSAQGVEIEATGGDTNIGITTTVTDGGTDIKCISSADSADYFSIATGSHGSTTITTTDAGGSNGALQITADGTAELAGTTVTLDSANNIELEVGAAANYINTAGVFRGSNIGVIQDGKIPISPTEFLASSYRFHPQYNLASGGITMASASVNAYCEVVIPNGYTATSCTMYGTDVDNDGAIRCYSGSTVAGSTSALATASTFSSGSVTHDFGANDVDGNGAVTVVIEWNPGDTVDVLFGGFISITKTT